MEATRWWWIRHAPAVGHGGRIYGDDDVACDTSDRAVFRGLAAVLPSGAVWITSHLTRTHETAAAILAEMTAPAVAVRHQERDLREQGFGDWQGLTNAELAERRDEAWHRFWLAPAHERPPAGESFEDVVARVTRTVERFSERYRGRDIVAVAHGGTIRAALAHALAVTPERALGFQVANCSLTRLDHFDGPAASDLPHALGSWRVGQVNSLFRSSDGDL